MEELLRRVTRLEERLAQLVPAEVARPIGAIYVTDAGQSIPTGGTGTVIDFEDLVYDPDGLVTTGANWVFTAPVDGLYAVASAVLFAASTTWAAIEAARLSVAVNGTVVRHVGRTTDFTNANIFVGANGATLVSCSAGDTIDVRVLQTSGGSLSLWTDADYNHVSIWKVN